MVLSPCFTLRKISTSYASAQMVAEWLFVLAPETRQDTSTQSDFCTTATPTPPEAPSRIHLPPPSPQRSAPSAPSSNSPSAVSRDIHSSSHNRILGPGPSKDRGVVILSIPRLVARFVTTTSVAALFKMPSTNNKRAAPVTSPHFSPLSATPEKRSKKRKIADGSGTTTSGIISDLKFYAVRAGKIPGVYDNWVDCQKQILGFDGEPKCKLITPDSVLLPPRLESVLTLCPGPFTDKRFNTLEEAENFIAGHEEPSGKYYGVVVGSTAGVYTDWDEVSELLKGSKGPKYKGFKTEAEAQDFVRANILSFKAGAKPTDVKVEAKAKVEAHRKLETKATVEGTGKRPPQKQPAASRTSPTIVYSDGSCLNNGKPNARAGLGVYFGAGDPRFVLRCACIFVFPFGTVC